MYAGQSVSEAVVLWLRVQERHVSNTAILYGVVSNAKIQQLNPVCICMESR